MRTIDEPHFTPEIAGAAQWRRSACWLPLVCATTFTGHESNFSFMSRIYLWDFREYQKDRSDYGYPLNVHSSLFSCRCDHWLIVRSGSGHRPWICCKWRVSNCMFRLTTWRSRWLGSYWSCCLNSWAYLPTIRRGQSYICKGRRYCRKRYGRSSP